MKLSLILLLCIFCYAHALDNPHFYKGSQFLYKPRLEEAELSSIYTSFAAGKSSSSLNCRGEKTALLNLYGPVNIRFLAENVPQAILDKNPDPFINNLWETSSHGCFGNLIFKGSIRVANINFEFFKNFNHGIFLDINIPVRKISIENIQFSDLSTYGNAGSVDFAAWKAYVNNLKQNLTSYGLQLRSDLEMSGAGDLTVMVGKTINYEETTKLDFIDCTLRGGLLLPTGRQSNPFVIFDIATGYDGFWGIPLCSSIALGSLEWFTLGSYLNVLSFISKKKCIGIKTAAEQSGQIKLYNDFAYIHKGPLTTFGLYTEADHFSKGFSLFLGYQYNNQHKTTLFSVNNSFDEEIANTDQSLLGWSMHTFNFMLEYDLADTEHPNRPRWSIGIDIPFAGKQIIPTKMGVVNVNLDIGCTF